MSEKPRCSKRVYGGTRAYFGGHSCSNPVKVQVGDKWYCGTHDPEAVKRREEKQREKWAAKSAAHDEKFARQAYNRKAGDACRALGITDPEKELPALIRKQTKGAKS